MGLDVKKNYEDVVFVDADRSKLAQIARLDAVFTVNEVLPLYLLSEETTTTGPRPAVGTTARRRYNDAGIDGGGENKASQADDQLLMIIDNGIQLDAGDLSNTVHRLRLRRLAPGTRRGGAPEGRVLRHDRSVRRQRRPPRLRFEHDQRRDPRTHRRRRRARATRRRFRSPTAPPGAASTAPATSGAWTAWRRRRGLVAYDGQITPSSAAATISTQIDPVSPTALDVGNLYTAPATGALADGYAQGRPHDQLLVGLGRQHLRHERRQDRRVLERQVRRRHLRRRRQRTDATRTLIAIPDPNTIGAPATAKNIICCRARAGTRTTSGDANRPDTALGDLEQRPRDHRQPAHRAAR